jgi:hypothetical protein
MIYHDLLTMVEHSHVNMKDKRRLGFLATKKKKKDWVIN